MQLKRILIRPSQIPLWRSGPSLSQWERNAFCIHCQDRPCIRYGDIFSEKTIEFPMDMNASVCPSGAMSWNKKDEIPEIDHDRCILCGSCLANCPAKCLYIKDNRIQINVDPVRIPDPRFLRMQLNSVAVAGWYACPSVEIASLMAQRIASMKGKILNPNILVRNVLRSLGWNAISYREGVQASTMDVLAWKDGITMSAEVEFGNQLINTPRNLIAYLPLLVERHHWNPASSILLAVCLSLPRRREEFWNVVDDVYHVLGLKIRIVTIIQLMFLVLTRQRFPIANNMPFPIVLNRMENLRQNLIFTHIPQGYLGFLEPEK